MTWRDRKGNTVERVYPRARVTLANGKPAYTRKDLQHGLSDEDADKLADWINKELDRDSDTHPKDGDGEATAPLVSGAVRLRNRPNLRAIK